ncbi:MAG: hypothetical protein HFI39_06840 [Lachnospiraceae bacterium]|nr:hypothetical protein [Lachnospiraceae bacterium]
MGLFSRTPKIDMDFTECGRRSMYFSFSDIEQSSRSFVDNVSQEEERQASIDRCKARL